MKNVLIALLLVLPNAALAAKAKKKKVVKPKKVVCQGVYKSPYRTLEVDGQGYCYMALDNMTFSGECKQEQDGSVVVYLGGNPFSGQYSADCATLQLDHQTYERQP